MDRPPKKAAWLEKYVKVFQYREAAGLLEEDYGAAAPKETAAERLGRRSADEKPLSDLWESTDNNYKDLADGRLGRPTARQLEQQGLAVPASYYRVQPQMTFDDLEPESSGFAALSFRIVRIETENSDSELLITNLDPKRFPPAALKRLYAMRWGIETSFRSLKYAVGLIHLHAKKPDLVLQEIFSSFFIFNFPQVSIWAADAALSASKYQ